MRGNDEDDKEKKDEENRLAKGGRGGVMTDAAAVARLFAVLEEPLDCVPDTQAAKQPFVAVPSALCVGTAGSLLSAAHCVAVGGGGR